MPPRAHKRSATPTEFVLIQKDGKKLHAQVLQRDECRAYVHYLERDKRWDEWIDNSSISTADTLTMRNPTKSIMSYPSMRREDEREIADLAARTAQRNFERVVCGENEIKPWYFSPYPSDQPERENGHAASEDGEADATPRARARARSLSYGPNSSVNGDTKTLWVCSLCFKYMYNPAAWELHTKFCKFIKPPGRMIYEHGTKRIYEVDGRDHKLYCQNLGLYGKLFIDFKTIHFELDNFLFYVVTEHYSKRDNVYGFFSKERVNFDNYNLACIVVFPPFQRSGYGMLLIEFSYELSRRRKQLEGPEKPLSDLGLRSYLAYWTATLIRYFRRALSVVPPEASEVRSNGVTINVGPLRPGEFTSVRPRHITIVDLMAVDQAIAEPRIMEDDLFKSRQLISKPASNGGAITEVELVCTLQDIALATNLQVADAAFALKECGLLTQRYKSKTTEKLPLTKPKPTGDRREEEEEEEEEEDWEYEDVLFITREMVERIAKEKKVKKPIMESHLVTL